MLIWLMDDLISAMSFFVATLNKLRNYLHLCLLTTLKHLFNQRQFPPLLACVEVWKQKSSLQSMMWSMCLVKERDIKNPSEWGWKENEIGYKPLWSEYEDASMACRELIKCGCKKSCRSRCKCRTQELPCTELCGCAGQCS